MSTTPKFNDRIIREGFPDGWFIQDRLDENVALLIRETPGMWPGSHCVCLRPKAMRTEEWLPIARELADAVSSVSAASNPSQLNSLVAYYLRQIEWSKQTFGPALRTQGVINHIRKELREIEQDPHDLSEWVDVIILAMDGFWRHGGKASDLFPALLGKQKKNMARTWPDWRTLSEDQPIEHDRSGE